MMGTGGVWEAVPWNWFRALTKHCAIKAYGGVDIYEAHPVSKVPWGRLQKQNTISCKYLLQQIQQVFTYFSTYSPPELRHLSYRGTNF
jgi:hypothetical protein